jgi:hypothetical protein
MSSRGVIYWLRRSVSRLALILGVCCIIELVMHFTEGTKPNTNMSLEDWPPFVAGMGLISLTVAWLTYVPPRRDVQSSDSDSSNRAN